MLIDKHTPKRAKSKKSATKVEAATEEKPKRKCVKKCATKK